MTDEDLPHDNSIFYYDGKNYWLDMGTHEVEMWGVSDASCGKTRYVDGMAVKVSTDVVKLTLTVGVMLNGVKIGSSTGYSTGNSGTPGTVNIPEGYTAADCTYEVSYFAYEDFRGKTRNCLSGLTRPDWAQVSTRTAPSGELWYEATVDGETATVDYEVVYED